jgi:hypothetical protein
VTLISTTITSSATPLLKKKLKTLVHASKIRRILTAIFFGERHELQIGNLNFVLMTYWNKSS